MGIFYGVNGGIKITAHGDFFFFVDNVADKCLLYQDKVLNLTNKGLDFKEQLEAFRTAKSAKATTMVDLIEKRIRYMYKIDAGDIEKQINIDNNPGLAELLGWTLSNYGGTHNKAPIEVMNGVTPGEVLVVLLAVEGAHDYNIECTQIGENGAADIITVRRMTNANGMLDGLASGAKYRFRSQGVLANDVLVEFTGYVELRIN